jgi:hypothetical protein
MIRRFAATLALFVFAIPAFAGNDGAGEYNFTMPFNDAGCIYTPDGGTDACETADGRDPLTCGWCLAHRGCQKTTHVDDASCCSAN